MSFGEFDAEFEFLHIIHVCSVRIREVLHEMLRMRSKTSGTSLSHLERYKLPLPSDVSDGVTEIIIDVAPESSLRMQHGVYFVSVGVPPDRKGNRMTDGVSTPRTLEISLFGETGDAPLHPLLQWPAGQRDNTHTVYSVAELVSFLDTLADFRHH